MNMGYLEEDEGLGFHKRFRNFRPSMRQRARVKRSRLIKRVRNRPIKPSILNNPASKANPYICKMVKRW